MAASLINFAVRGIFSSSHTCSSTIKLFDHCSRRHITTFSFLAAKKGAGGKGIVGTGPTRERLKVETDAHKLHSYLCGGNILKDGVDPPIRPESEYPDWLWTLRTERGFPDLNELTEDDPIYWRILKKNKRKQQMKIMKTRYRYRKF